MKKLENLKEFQLKNEMNEIIGGDSVNMYIAGQWYVGETTQTRAIETGVQSCADFRGTVDGKPIYHSDCSIRGFWG